MLQVASYLSAIALFPSSSILIIDVLLYVSEGYLPFLHAFYGQAYQNRHTTTSRQMMQETKPDTICEALTVRLLIL